MDYLKIYQTLIKRGKLRIKQKRDGLHKHRILPGHEGGKYIKENITLLTRKEHRIIHKLRYKLYNNKGDKISSIWLSSKLTEDKINILIQNGSIRGGIISSEKNKLLKKGIFSLSSKDLSEYGKIGGKKTYELHTGIHKLTKEDRQNQQLKGAKNRKTRFNKDVDFREKIIINAKNNLQKITFEKKSQGGKTQGRKNAESGHCKKISRLGGLIQGPKNIEFLKEITKKQRKAIIVNNVIYESQTAAGKEFNICAASVAGRIKSKHFPNWNYYLN